MVDSGANVLALTSEGTMPYDLCEDETTLDVIESAMTDQGTTRRDTTRTAQNRNRNGNENATNKNPISSEVTS